MQLMRQGFGETPRTVLAADIRVLDDAVAARAVCDVVERGAELEDLLQP